MHLRVYETILESHAFSQVFGTVRELLQCTYDLRSMSPEQILEKLPREFDVWTNGTPA